MQIRSYLRYITFQRLRRGLVSPRDNRTPTPTSPSLLYAAVVLALLLVILEIDLHRGELDSMGFVGNAYPVPPNLMGP